MDKEINVVQLHVHYKMYHTGIDRYLEMYTKGINKKIYSNIKVHKIYITDDRDIVFPRLIITRNGTLHATIPMVYDNLLISTDGFWKRRSMRIIVDLVKPYLKGRPNLIYQCHYLYLAILAEEMKNELGGKILTHLHCIQWKFSYNRDEKHYNLMHQLYETRRFEELNKEEQSSVDYGPSDKIICLSKAAKDYLVYTKKVAPDKIEIIMNGLAPVANDAASRNGPTKILYAGKISKDKGCFKMFEILDSVRQKGYDFEVVIAGSISDSDKSRIYNKHSKLRLTFLGQVPYSELKDLYRTCTMGIIPSMHEQCSYVAIEMSMFGVPMVVSKVDALQEMFRDKETALMVPQVFDPDIGLDFDREIFINNVISLIEKDELRKYLGENAKQAYKELFTLDRMIERTVELYKRLV